MKTYKGCKMYTQYGSKVGFIVCIITAGILLPICFVMVGIALECKEEPFILALFIFVTLMLLGLVALLVVCSVFSYKGYQKILEIKQGTKAVGHVDRFFLVGGKMPYYQLIYSYTNEKMEMCYTKTSVDCQWGRNLLSKTTVPIYVKGEYSFLDIDEAKALAPSFTYDRSMMKTCPHCKNMLKGSERYCKNCKNSV